MWRIVHQTPMLLGESPLWEPREQALYWVDIPGKAVHRKVDPGGTHVMWPMPCEPGCIARASDGLLVALRSGINHLNTMTGVLTEIAAAPYDCTRERFNDGKCDPEGRFWAGTIYEPRDCSAGSLYCLERGQLRDTRLSLTVSNGLAFSPDGARMLHADTPQHRILSYSFDRKVGAWGAGTLLKQFEMKGVGQAYGGRPDGATVDADGGYWVAMFEGARVIRINASGAVTHEIEVPFPCPTMVTFGGPDLDTLYVTSAGLRRPAEELERFPLSGVVLAMKVQARGLIEPVYVP